jgi:methylase of polypeptide subunit release factors
VAQFETEWTVVGDAKSWMDALIDAHRSNSPFSKVKLETRTTGSLKRRDLTVLDRDGKICLTGEVKVPWANDGASPFVESTVVDARKKAVAAGSPWFFTWNLNELVLWRTESFGDLGAERGFQSWTVSSIRRQLDLQNPRFERELRDGIERFFLGFMKLFKGEDQLPRRAPDEYFIHAFDSFLAWPILVATQALIERDNMPLVRSLVDRWMRDEQGWTLVGDRAEMLGRAARFASYAVASKLVFYDALRKRFTDLPNLTISDSVSDGDGLIEQISSFFDNAQHTTGDYETVFGSVTADIGMRLPFYDPAVVNPWREFVLQLERFDLSKLDYDVIGRIFERLIDPKERHKYGQYYTRPEVVDLINAFAIRNGEDVVLDPGCGGGTFLVRAYARKKRLAPRLKHGELLGGVFGTDVSPFAAHLSTINLATRDLVEDANYPRVKRVDFFDVKAGAGFLTFPKEGGGKQQILVPRFNAIVGNPPYVRQEDVPPESKLKYAAVARTTGLLANGRSDLHIYFWGQALALMAPDARLGFLASSQWLDAEYGFPLQAWLLENFRVQAIIESRDEPWFVGARVATVAAIAEREADPEKRDAGLVRFVEMRRPIAELLAGDKSSQGALEAAEHLRDAILACETDTENDGWRVRVIRQGDLREAGVRLGERTKGKSVYAGGKWGIPLRAPDLWSELVSLGGDRWRSMAELAEVRFGVKSGCDEFFYVTDWSAKGLAEFPDANEFEQHYRVARKIVDAGGVTLAKTGKGEVHPVETQYLKPIVHSLMDIDAYKIEARHCDKLALMVSATPDALKNSHVGRYIAWGERQAFHRGATCSQRGKARQWYDLTPDVVDADVLWVKERQYRFAALSNPEHFPANCRLYTVSFADGVDAECQSAILNSSLVVLSTLMFGRPVGVEGSWSTMVLDANMLQVPVCDGVSKKLRSKICEAHEKMSRRGILGFVSAQRLRRKSYTEREKLVELNALSDASELDQPDRYALDDAVLELLGVADKAERKRLRGALYDHLRAYFESVRAKEEEAIDNKRIAKKQTTLGADQIATDVVAEIDREYPALRRFYYDLTKGAAIGDGVRIPEHGVPEMVDDLVTMGVRFVAGRNSEIVNTKSKVQAELVIAITSVGPRGKSLFLPRDEEQARPFIDTLNSIASDRRRVARELIEARTADPELMQSAFDKVQSILMAGVARPRRAAIAPAE